MSIIGGQNCGDSAHWRNQFSDCPMIKINGEFVFRVIEADDVEGFIVVEVYEDGRLKRDQTGRRILTKRVEGKVEIIGPLLDRSQG